MKNNGNKRFVKLRSKLIVLLVVNFMVFIGIMLNFNNYKFSDGIKTFLTHYSNYLEFNIRNKAAEMSRSGGNTVPLRSSEHNVNTTHLSDVFFKLEINHEEVNPEKPVIIHEGETFEIGFIFQETTLYQYMDDDTPMTYVLPEGFVIPEFNMQNLDISVNDLGTIVTVHEIM